ncbi:MAG: hypothetical protein Q8R81_16880 [Novosphingobium sp.]|uniref:hypothetical protein n=1 Tax=Novosphingobium sp. TaxID=1874826 RepID=UPI0027377AAE|nr:hypothetical protein [Novosphingobium sp.]MDP3552057.1 hypothetical protein [Novosphingobium sp.]
MRLAAILLPAAALMLPGCVAKSAFDLVTMPVRAGAQAVNTTAGVYDRVTVSQSERDQKLGRQIRQREERYGRLARDYDRARADCRDGEDDACDDARRIYGEMNALRASVPYQPE